MTVVGGVIAALVALLAGTSGFGFGLLATPLLLLAGFSLPFVVTVNLLVSVASRISVAFRLRRHIEPRRVALLVAGSVPGLYAGARLLGSVDRQTVKITVGIVIMAAAAALIYAERHPPSLRPRDAVVTAAGFLGGLLGTTTSLIGVPPALLLARRRLGPAHFFADMAVFFIVTGAIGCLVLAVDGDFDEDGARSFLWWLPGVLVANVVGTTLGLRLPDRVFRMTTLSLAFAAGAVTAATASAATVPTRCPAGGVPRDATVAFVVDGTAWALDPRRDVMRCLFHVPDPGPFKWGPRGDRALLAHLEVRSLGRAPHRPPSRVASPSASWGRPIGKSIVFVGRGGRALLKTHPGGGAFHDVTPVRGARYKRVAYHPSGLALGFILKRKGHESLWISSNTGRDPHQLVHGRFHTAFETLAFGPLGDKVYFAAQHADHHVDVHVLPLVGANSAPVVWRGKPGEHVYGIAADFPDVALTVGRSCASRRVVVVGEGKDDVHEPLPRVRPSRAVGWYGARELLIATGGCGRKLDLYAYDSERRQARLLVRNVDAAATRRPEQLPPPPYPKAGAPSSFA